MLAGLGMGFVTLATLVEVQNSVDMSDLGVATSSNQFARTLGGTVGVGICGGLMNASLWRAMQGFVEEGLIPAGEGAVINADSLDTLMRPEFQGQLSESARTAFQAAIVGSVSIVFWIVLAAALVCLVFCALLPSSSDSS
jgi:hypothetical protein